MAFFSTPGMERLYSGVTNSRPCEAEISAFSRLTESACLSSSSWLYKGRSPISNGWHVKSGGTSRVSAMANLRLKESFLRLPTTPALLEWAMMRELKGVGLGNRWTGSDKQSGRAL